MRVPWTTTCEQSVYDLLSHIHCSSMCVLHAVRLATLFEHAHEVLKVTGQCEWVWQRCRSYSAYLPSAWSQCSQTPSSWSTRSPQGVRQERHRDRARTLKYGRQLFRHLLRQKARPAGPLPAQLSPSERETHFSSDWRKLFHVRFSVRKKIEIQCEIFSLVPRPSACEWCWKVWGRS